MFCSNCGRPLQDGEICECQKQGNTTEAAQQADNTLKEAAAQADAVIAGAAQAPIDPIKARIEQEQAAQAQAAAQNANNRANQYYQQYAPQNQQPAQNTQYGIPNQAQYSQPNAQSNFGGQPGYGQQGTQYGQQNAQYGQPNPQYRQAGAPYGQPGQQYGQGYNNPYGNNQVPPSYYGQPMYDTDEERLKKYMSNPKFVLARDIMASPIVLVYALAVSAVLVFNFVALQSFLHPLFILLCIAAWITFASGVSSKKNNKLPSTAGLSIASGVAITLMVIWCIGFGLMILLAILGLFGSLTSGAGGSGYIVMVMAIFLAICILFLVFGIKYYSLQSRNLKGVRFCITNEADPPRFSIFPAVILIIGIVLSIIGIFSAESIFGSAKLQDFVRDSLIREFKEIGIDSIKSGYSSELTEQLIEMIFSSKTRILTYISSVLNMVLMGSTAALYFNIKKKLNQFYTI